MRHASCVILVAGLLPDHSLGCGLRTLCDTLVDGSVDVALVGALDDHVLEGDGRLRLYHQLAGKANTVLEPGRGRRGTSERSSLNSPPYRVMMEELTLAQTAG